MTLVAIIYTKANGFASYSDSRVSQNSDANRSRVADRFTKIFKIPFKFTYAKKNKRHKLPTTKFLASGDVGFAFAGSTLAATALVNMATNTLDNMHSVNGVSRLPAFKTLSETIVRLAKILHRDTIVNPLVYQSIVFGYCPKTGDPKLTVIGFEKINEVFEVVAHECDPHEGEVFVMGSGKSYLLEIMKRPGSKEVPFSHIFAKAVAENNDAGTGGAIQSLVISRRVREYQGVIQKSVGDGSVDEIYFSGVGIGEIGEIDGFTVGRSAVAAFRDRF